MWAKQQKGFRYRSKWREFHRPKVSHVSTLLSWHIIIFHLYVCHGQDYSHSSFRLGCFIIGFTKICLNCMITLLSVGYVFTQTHLDQNRLLLKNTNLKNIYISALSFHSCYWPEEDFYETDNLSAMFEPYAFLNHLRFNEMNKTCI